MAEFKNMLGLVVQIPDSSKISNENVPGSDFYEEMAPKRQDVSVQKRLSAARENLKRQLSGR